MAGEANLTTSAAILKTKYTQPKVYWIAYTRNAWFAEIRKDTTFDGANKVIAIQTETPQGAGSSIGQAQSNLAASVYKNFLITRIEDFAVARVKGQAMRAAAKNTGALIDLWTREMDGAIQTNTRSAAINMCRSGTGTRAAISSGSTVGSTLITLGNTSDITNFAVGMAIQLTATDGGAPRAGGTQNPAIITGIDRVAGTLTLASNWSTAITGATAGDFIVRAGDAVGAVTAGANTMITGASGWVPDGNGTNRPQSNDSFFGLNRYSDPARLAGFYTNGAGIPFQEVIIQAMAQCAVEGAMPDRVWMHPRDRANLVLELGAKVQYTKVTVKVPGSDANVGFDAIEFESDGVKALVMSDINVPRSNCYVTQWDTWSLESLGPAPMVLNFDSNDFLRVSNDDQYEVRVGYYAQESNMAPAYTNHIYNFGN